MYPKLLHFLIIISLASALTGSNIELQMRRMEYIQNLIDQRKSMLKESQEQKQEILEAREDVQASLYETLLNIRHLSMREYELIEEIIKTEHTVDGVEKRLNKLTELCREQVSRFYINHLTGSKDSYEQAEQIYFPLLINRTSREIIQETDLLATLQYNLQHGRQDREEIHREREMQEYSSRLISMEIDRLHTIIDSLNTEELAYLEEVQGLERNRLAIESLIELLQSDEHSYSYKFTKDKIDLPVNGEIINYFGEVRDESNRLVLINQGIDIVSDVMQTVKAVDFGVVVFAEPFRNYGRLVIIDHLNGYYSLYAQNSSLLVAKGDSVSPGEPIAEMGKTADGSSYILHFGLRRHNKAVNPLDYIN